jgi:hypothetical protein
MHGGKSGSDTQPERSVLQEAEDEEAFKLE